MIVLDTKPTDSGAALTFSGGDHADENAGTLAYDSGYYRFNAPDGTWSPRRRNMTAAGYDALAYWEDVRDVRPYTSNVSD